MKKMSYFYVFYVFVLNIFSLNTEQESFIKLFSPPADIQYQCDIIFSHLDLKQQLNSKAANKNSIESYFKKAGFNMIKCELRNIKQEYEGDIKIIATHSRVPRYIFKMQFGLRYAQAKKKRSFSNLSRLIGAERLRKEALYLGCKQIEIPQKFLVHIAGMPFELEDEHYIVLAEKISILENYNLSTFLSIPHLVTPSHLEELFKLLYAIGCYDVKDENIVFTPNNTIALIDTEEAAGYWDKNDPFSWMPTFAVPFAWMRTKRKIHKYVYKKQRLLS